MTVADEVGFALENQGEEPEVIARKVSETLQLAGLAVMSLQRLYLD